MGRRTLRLRLTRRVRAALRYIAPVKGEKQSSLQDGTQQTRQITYVQDV